MFLFLIVAARVNLAISLIEDNVLKKVRAIGIMESHLTLVSSREEQRKVLTAGIFLVQTALVQRVAGLGLLEHHAFRT